MVDKQLTSSDAANSTTTPLLSGQTWMGEWTRIPDNKNIRFNVLSDVGGTVYVDFSHDEVSYYTDPVLGFDVIGNQPRMHIVLQQAEYYRLRYVNNGTDQASFSLFAYYVDVDLIKTHPLNDVIYRDDDCILVRSTSPQDDITRGLVDNVSQLNKFGYREDVDTTDGDALIIADNTTNTPTILTTASTFTITYNNSTDGLGTTGALTLLITYLDENEDQINANIVLGNTGSDVTAFSGLGINRAVVTSNGGAEVNTSDITITATTGGSVQAFIPAGVSVTEQIWGHIPANTSGVSKFIFLSGVKSSGGGNPIIQFKVFVYNRGTATKYEVFRYTMDTSAETSLSIVDPINFAFSPRDVFWVTASTNSNNTEVKGRLSLNLYKNRT